MTLPAIIFVSLLRVELLWAKRRGAGPPAGLAHRIRLVDARRRPATIFAGTHVLHSVGFPAMAPDYKIALD